jgi:hypothetical protein
MSRITDYASVAQVQADDVLVVVDVHDTSMSPAGTTKQATAGQLLAGLTWKAPVQQATVAPLPANTYDPVAQTLTATANGLLTVDGVTCVATQRLLVSLEGTAQDNGIYVVTQAGDAGHPYVLTRAADMASGSQITGAAVLVEQGAVAAGSGWFIEGAGPDVIGSTAIFWTKFTQIISGAAPLAVPGVPDPGASGFVSDARHVHGPSGTGATSAVAVPATTETAIATISVPAGLPAGASFRVKAWVSVTVGATAGTFGTKLRIGGVAGTQIGGSNTSAAMTASGTGIWVIDADVTLQAPGAAATWSGQCSQRGLFGGGTTSSSEIAGTATFSSLSPTTIVVTVTLGSATSAASCLGSVVERSA